jgi:hypothetical protein
MNRPGVGSPLARPPLFVLLGLAVGYLFGPSFLRAFRCEGPMDFVQEWASARNYFAGLSIYEEQESALYHHLGYVRQPGVFFLEVNPRPPTSVLLALPLADLGHAGALLVWSLLSLAALGGSIALIVRELRLAVSPGSLGIILLLVVVSGAVGPLHNQIKQGQWNLFLLLLITGAWAASRNGRPCLAGALLGLATAIKLFPGLLFLYFLLQRRWRTVCAGLAALALLTALTALTFGLDAYRTYVFDILPQLAPYRAAWASLCLRAVWCRLFDPGTALSTSIPVVASPLLARVFTLLSCGLVLGCVAREALRARTEGQRDQAFVLWVIAMLLVSPLAWDHDLLLLLLPAVLYWTTLPASGPVRWALVACLVPLVIHCHRCWILFVRDPRLDWLPLTAKPWHTLTVLALQTYAVLGLFGLGLLAARRQRAASSRPDLDGALARAA